MELLEQLKARGITRVQLSLHGSEDREEIEAVYTLDASKLEVDVGKIQETLIKLAETILDCGGICGTIHIESEENPKSNDGYLEYKVKIHKGQTKAHPTN